jgi:hypothetical protein
VNRAVVVVAASPPSSERPLSSTAKVHPRKGMTLLGWHGRFSTRKGGIRLGD